MRSQHKTDRAPFTPGDGLLLAPRLTALPVPAWGRVELIQRIPSQGILRGGGGTHAWKIGYRVERNEADSQLGVVNVDDTGHSPEGFVLAIKRQLAAPTTTIGRHTS